MMQRNFFISLNYTMLLLSVKILKYVYWNRSYSQDITNPKVATKHLCPKVKRIKTSLTSLSMRLFRSMSSAPVVSYCYKDRF